MDRCLRLALLDTAHRVPLVAEIARLRRRDRSARYDELCRVEVPPHVDAGRWTGHAMLHDAVPPGVDPVIRDLAGVQRYRGLRLLQLTEAAVTDLGPLTGLPALALLSVGVAAGTDLRPLLACARLTRVAVASTAGPFSPAQHAVLVALADRGVAVDPLLPDPATLTAPFADPMLKLAVIDLLRLPLPVVETFDEYALDEGNLARVLALELTPAQLDSVERLHWMGGGYAIQHAVWSQWDGESGEFDIRTLRGIESLRNLERLEVSPLDTLPPAEVAALRAAGVTVTPA